VKWFLKILGLFMIVIFHEFNQSYMLMMLLFCVETPSKDLLTVNERTYLNQSQSDCEGFRVCAVESELADEIYPSFNVLD